MGERVGDVFQVHPWSSRRRRLWFDDEDGVGELDFGSRFFQGERFVCFTVEEI